MAEGAPGSLRVTQMRHRCGKSGIGEGKSHHHRDRQEEWRGRDEPEGCEDADPGKQSVAETGQRGKQQNRACRGHRESTLSIIRSSALLPPPAGRSSGLAEIVALRGGR